MTMVGWRGPWMQGVRGRQSLFVGCGWVDGVVGGVVCWLLVRGVVMVIPPSCLICLRGGDVGLLARAAGPIRCRWPLVDLFFNAAPPRRCSSLLDVGGHRRAAAMGAGDDEAEKFCR